MLSAVARVLRAQPTQSRISRATLSSWLTELLSSGAEGAHSGLLFLFTNLSFAPPPQISLSCPPQTAFGQACPGTL